MKRIIYLIILFTFYTTGCKTTAPAIKADSEMKNTLAVADSPDKAEVNFSDQITWLLGYFSPGQMTREPHSRWYMKGYDEYQLNTEPLEKLLEVNKDGLTIKLVMGSWCPDSRREVPRFMRILEKWQFPTGNVTFIGVDNAKLSPVGEYTSLNIERVPTFIFYRNNIEVGRIIENPLTSLEQDMVNILTSNE